LETNPALLAIIGDIDANLVLFLEHVGNAAIHLLSKLALVDRSAQLFLDQ
jgi:hypothetical protein